MSDDGKLALFIMLAQTASKTIGKIPEVVAGDRLMISEHYDLTSSLPESVKSANKASEGYRLFFVFENYLERICCRNNHKDLE